MSTGLRTRAAEREETLLRIITDCASNGLPCPTNGELCDLLSMESVGSTSGVMSRLEKRGLVQVERGHTCRIVTIVSTGRKTAGVVKSAHWRLSRDPKPRSDKKVGPAPHAEPDAEHLERVERDPCPRCGVRGDIGCSHTRTERLVA